MDRLLTMPEVAEIARAPLETLRSWRAQGIGPEGFRLVAAGRLPQVRHARWIEAQFDAQRTTPQSGVPLPRPRRERSEAERRQEIVGDRSRSEPAPHVK